MDVRELGAKPRPLKILNTKDGMIRTFADDGGAITDDGQFKPNTRRIEIQKMRGKVNGPIPLWVAVEPIKPAFRGDPLADFPVLDKRIEAQVKKNLEKRKERTAIARKQAAGELASLAAKAPKTPADDGKGSGGADG